MVQNTVTNHGRHSAVTAQVAGRHVRGKILLRKLHHLTEACDPCPIRPVPPEGTHLQERVPARWQGTDIFFQGAAFPERNPFRDPNVAGKRKLTRVTSADKRKSASFQYPSHSWQLHHTNARTEIPSTASCCHGGCTETNPLVIFKKHSKKKIRYAGRADPKSPRPRRGSKKR
jgi:hypothetical protein